MARKRQYSSANKRQQRATARPPMASHPSETLAARRAEPKKEYGPPFILLEDAQLNTFLYVRGAWVPYEKRIAECRLDCHVSALPQKVNNMTRYEIRLQVN
jgi:hypothetical protein